MKSIAVVEMMFITVVLFTLILRREADAAVKRQTLPGDVSPECFHLTFTEKEQQCFSDSSYDYDSDGSRDVDYGSAPFPVHDTADDYDYNEGSGFSANAFDFAKSCSSKICWNAMNKFLSKCKVSSHMCASYTAPAGCILSCMGMVASLWYVCCDVHNQSRMCQYPVMMYSTRLFKCLYVTLSPNLFAQACILKNKIFIAIKTRLLRIVTKILETT